MIRSAEEARKVLGINFPSSYWNGKSLADVHADQCVAFGYLSALKGPEIKELIYVLEYYRAIDSGENPYNIPKGARYPEAYAALARFKAMATNV